MLPIYEIIGLSGALNDELNTAIPEEAEIEYAKCEYDKLKDVPLQEIQRVSLHQLTQRAKTIYLRPFEQWVQDIRDGKRDINDL